MPKIGLYIYAHLVGFSLSSMVSPYISLLFSIVGREAYWQGNRSKKSFKWAIYLFIYNSYIPCHYLVHFKCKIRLKKLISDEISSMHQIQDKTWTYYTHILSLFSFFEVVLASLLLFSFVDLPRMSANGILHITHIYRFIF